MAAVAMEIEKRRLPKLLADWLVLSLGECSIAMPVPPSLSADVWGTPDVIGVRFGDETRGAPDETVAIKIAHSPACLPAAFGQACSFKLRCHRAYVAALDDFGASEVDWAVPVCLAFRIGLIAVGTLEGTMPVIGLRVRAVADPPNPFASNIWIGQLMTARD